MSGGNSPANEDTLDEQLFGEQDQVRPFASGETAGDRVDACPFCGGEARHSNDIV